MLIADNNINNDEKGITSLYYRHKKFKKYYRVKLILHRRKKEIMKASVEKPNPSFRMNDINFL